MGRSSVLITPVVEVYNTIVSFGGYSFHKKSKAVMQKKSKKSKEAVIWTPQGENLEQRAIQSTSTLGAFVAMNLGTIDDVHRQIESL